MSDDLSTRHCQACEGLAGPLSSAEIAELKQSLHGDWEIDAGGRSISRRFRFSDYYRTMAFVNAVAFIAHVEDHHPDLSVGYSQCHVVWSTHAVDGLSENDFICAAKVDALVQSDE